RGADAALLPSALLLCGEPHRIRSQRDRGLPSDDSADFEQDSRTGACEHRFLSVGQVPAADIDVGNAPRRVSGQCWLGGGRMNARRVVKWTLGVLLVLAVIGFLAFLYFIP